MRVKKKPWERNTRLTSNTTSKRVLVTQPQKQTQNIKLVRWRPQPLALDGAPGALTRARGGYDDSGSGTCDDGSTLLVCVKQLQTPQKKNKNNRKNRPQTPMPPPVQEKDSEGASELGPPNAPREPKKTKYARAPEWHPDKTPERKDARPKRAMTQSLLNLGYISEKKQTATARNLGKKKRTQKQET